MATVPLTIQFLAQKGANFDQVTKSVAKQVEEARSASSTGSGANQNQAAEAELRRLTDQVAQMRVQAENSAAAIAKLKAEAAKPTKEWIQKPAVPADLEGKAKSASAALAKLREQIQAVSGAGGTGDRSFGIQSAGVELAKFRLQNLTVISQVPQLRHEYQAVAGQIRVATSEAKLLAAQESKVAEASRQTAQQQRQLAEEAKRRGSEERKAASDTAGVFQKAADLGRSVGTALVGTGVAMLGLGGLALQTAGQFEQLQARLESVAKSGAQAQKLFQQAVTYAAATPFDLSGMVQATITLTSFQQSAKSTLPAVSNLAAAMGKRIEDVALVMGKALSGSLEGFESLRNEFGISNADLKKYGASLTATGTIATLTTTDIDKARGALLKLIQVRFGDAVAKQANTLFAQMNRVSDSIQRVGASFGKGLLPLVRGGADGLTGFLDFFDGLDSVTKHVLTLGTVGVGAFSVFSGSVLLAASAGHSLFTKFREVQAVMAPVRVALTAAGAAFGKFADSMLRSVIPEAYAARVGSLTAGFTRLAPALGATGVAVVALSAYFEVLHQRMKEIDDAIVGASRAFHDARQSVKDYGNAINAAAGGQFVTFSRDVAKTAKEMAKASKALSTSEFVGGLEKQGLTLQQVRKDLEANASATEDYASKQKALQDLLKIETKKTRNTRTGEEFDLGYQIPESLRGLFDGQAQASAERVEEVLKEVNFGLSATKVAATEMKFVEKAFQAWQEPMAKALDSTKKLDNYLQFASANKDILTLRNNLTLVNKELDQYATVAAGDGKKNRGLGLPTTEADLTKRLLKVEDGTFESNFIKGYLKLYEEQRKAREALRAYDQAADAERLTQLDRQFALEKSRSAVSINGKSAELKSERDFLEKRLALVKGAIDREAALVKQLNALRQQKPSGARETAIQDVEAQLVLARKAADEQRSTEDRLRGNKQASLQEEVRLQKTAIESQVKSSLEYIKQLKEDGAPSEELIGGYDRVLRKIEDWKRALKDVAGSKDLRKAADDLKRQVDGEQRGARKQQRSENLASSQAGFSEAMATETNLEQKQLLVKNQIESIESNIARHAIDRIEGARVLNQLTKQQADLTRQVEQRENRDAMERSRLQQTNLDEELLLLEQRAQAGESLESKMRAVRRERFQESLNYIKLEQRAEEEAGATKEQAEQKASAAIKTLLRKEYMDRVQKYADTERAEQEHLRKLDEMRRNRLGGPNSPIMSAEEMAEGMNMFGSFSLDTMKKPGNSKKKAPTVADVARDLGMDGNLIKLTERATQDPLTRQHALTQTAVPESLRQKMAESARVPSSVRQLEETVNRARETAKPSPVSAETGKQIINAQASFNGLSMFGPEFESAVTRVLLKVAADAKFKAG